MAIFWLLFAMGNAWALVEGVRNDWPVWIVAINLTVTLLAVGLAVRDSE